MSYTITVSRSSWVPPRMSGGMHEVGGHTRWKAVSQEEVGTIDAVQEWCHNYVQDRMDAFSEDREALERYGYLAAEDWALSVPEDGGTFTLADGMRIEVVKNDEQ